MKKWLVLALLAMPSCASYQTAAGLYSERGQHELAVFYLVGNFHSQGQKAKKDLVLGIQNALRTIDAEYASQVKQGNLQAALGAATRREALLDFARSLGLFEFAAIDASRISQQALRRAAKQALQQLDSAEAAEKPILELTQLTRIALALDPHNPELAQRYERLLSSQRTNLVVRAQCDQKYHQACQHFVGLLMTHLTRERRELTRLVPRQSQIRNTELLVRLSVQRQEGAWRRIKSGRSEKNIEQKNRFKETLRDTKGEKRYQTVRARFELFENKTWAKVDIHIQISNLRHKGGLILETRANRTESDKRNYVNWQGDERALGDLLRVGTDQTRPKNPQNLTRLAMRKLAASLSKQILSKLEGFTP